MGFFTRTLQVLFIAIGLFSISSLMTGCLLSDFEESGTHIVSDPSTAPATPDADPTKTVCDPFHTNSPQARDRGLVGNLFYLTDDQPRYGMLADFMANAHIASATIYLDRVYTPTRPFDRGFYTQAGDLVLTASGTTLYEYFGLHLETQIQLAANEAPGLYQLALLADDGAVLKIPDGNGGLKTLVNDDGTHSTKFACATEPVYLDHNTKIPVVMDYFQGPRYHISFIAMWRPWTGASASDTTGTVDPYCGRQGNSLFFDSTQNPVTAKPAFYELLERNWKVLENENYNFPNQVVNPCVPTEEPLAITSFSISGVLRDRVTLTWITNIPSTSQGESKNIATGATAQTSIDTTMVESHSLTITGLLPNTLYSVKALSTSAGGQNAISDERAFRTPR